MMRYIQRSIVLKIISTATIAILLIISLKASSVTAQQYTVKFVAKYVSGDYVLRNVFYYLDNGRPNLLGTVLDRGEFTFSANFSRSIRVHVNVNPGTVYYEELYINGTLVAKGNVGDEGLTYTLPGVEPRAYLPLVMSNFCWPISIPADARLFGVVFFDYNGDGIKQPNEPGAEGANIFVGGESTLSQCQGVYYFRNLPDGVYDLIVTSPGFRYLSISRSEFKATGTPLQVTISGRTERNIGLMQGFLTMPFSRNANARISEYFDYDPRYYKYLWWNGQAGDGVWRNHVGTDFAVASNGTPVVAAAPGMVAHISRDLYSGSCVSVKINAINEIYWGACHITPTVSVGQFLSRGDLIGYVDFPSFPHVHLDIGQPKSDGFYFIDPFVPLDPNICAEWKWAPNNDPIYVKANCSPGFWTVKNNPQPFD